MSNNTSSLVQHLCEFIAQSPTPFHATRNLLDEFSQAGFQILSEQEDWNIRDNSAYVITRNDSSIIAFRTGQNFRNGIKMLGAHTDSPCLRIKPNPELNTKGYNQLGVEVYGGALLHPWLDRDLSIAGRVSGVDSKGELFNELIDFKQPIAIIPNLAIHLDREANSKRAINPQRHLPLVIGQMEEFSFKELLAQQCQTKVDKILEFELSCYDTQLPQLTGLNKDFLSAARLDNLLSSYVAARALIDADDEHTGLFVSNDHEEVGSASACGAQGPFLKSTIERLIDSPAQQTQLISRSMMLSCDNAHGIHPNYIDKHDANHGPILNQGPVIKINNNQRYATNSITSAKFQYVCEQAGVPLQSFVTRSDMACGSTIGPITASELGVETLDVGVPQWGMHSIRETAGARDCDYLHKACRAFLAS